MFFDWDEYLFQKSLPSNKLWIVDVVMGAMTISLFWVMHI